MLRSSGQDTRNPAAGAGSAIPGMSGGSSRFANNSIGGPPPRWAPVPAPIIPFTNITYATPNPGYQVSEWRGSSQPQPATAGHHHQRTAPGNTPLTAVTPVPAASNILQPSTDDRARLPSQWLRAVATTPEIATGQIADGVTQTAVLSQVTAPRQQHRLRRMPSYWDLREAARAQDAAGGGGAKGGAPSHEA
jgi:hypothetical protein